MVAAPEHLLRLLAHDAARQIVAVEQCGKLGVWYSYRLPIPRLEHLVPAERSQARHRVEPPPTGAKKTADPRGADEPIPIVVFPNSFGHLRSGQGKGALGPRESHGAILFYSHRTPVRKSPCAACVIRRALYDGGMSFHIEASKGFSRVWIVRKTFADAFTAVARLRGVGWAIKLRRGPR